MKIIFIRHGEINPKTNTLSKNGIKQIKGATKYLKNENICSIYSSPRTRAIQTANILNSIFKVDINIEKGLNERQLLTEKERLVFHEEFDKNYLNYDFQTDNFETCKDFIDRNFESFNRILSYHKDADTILIAAHSSTLYALNAFVNGIPNNNIINWLQCSNGAVIKFYI